MTANSSPRLRSSRPSSTSSSPTTASSSIPACGSGGMFVQSSYFIEDAGEDTMKRGTFYGHEKNETTAKLSQINLAVHGLQGTIRAGNEAITYYKDPHELAREM